MAGKITELNGAVQATALDGTELIELVQGGVNKFGLISQIATFLGITSGVKVYRALLTQSGSGAPVATVLENSLSGTVVWTRNSAGNYTGTLAAAFPLAKTVTNMNSGGETISTPYAMERANDNTLLVVTSEETDGTLTSRFVEILVYP